MKIFFILLLTIHFASAEELCLIGEQENDLIESCKKIAIPNCLTRTKLNFAQKGKLSPLCQQCQRDFKDKALLTMTESKPLSPEEILTKKKDLFFNIIFQDYKKNLTNTLVEIAKLRSIESTRSTFSKSIEQCQFKKPDAFTGCSPEMKKRLTNNLEKLQQDLHGEIAQLISKTIPKNRSTGILNRSNAAKLCPIPDRDLLFLQTLAIEESFSPQVIQAFSQMSGENFTDLDALLGKLEDQGVKNIKELRGAINSHPLLSVYNENPKAFISLIQKLDPKNAQGLRNSLYSSENGDQFDERLAKNCQDTFDALKTSICTPEFENGDLSINAFTKNDYLEEDLSASDSDFAADDMAIKKHLVVFNYCQISESKGSLKLEEKLGEINQSLRQDLATLPLKDFQLKKYEQDMASLNEGLCNIANKSIECIPGDPLCEAYKRYKSPSEVDKKFAASSNNEVNDLLRSFLGNPKSLSPEVKMVLISEGILPKDDGSMVAQTEVPERQNGYFSQAPTIRPPSKVMPVTSAQASVPSSRSSSFNAAPNNYAVNPTYAPNAYPAPDFSDLMGNDQDMRDIQREIMRRLSNLPDKRPLTKNMARKIVRDSFKTKGRDLPYEREDRFASRMMEPYGRDEAYHPNTDDYRRSDRGGVASANMRSAAEKYKKDGMNRALSEMGGAKEAMGLNRRNPAGVSDENGKALTTASLSITEDPKISLSKLFSEKFHANDEETKLLKDLVKGQKDFLLEVRGVSFKVVFDRNQNMNLLLADGDKQEAQKLRPELEVFFRRLKAI